MLITPHKPFLSRNPGFKQFLDSENASSRFIVGFRNQLTKNNEIILIQQDSKLALTFSYHLKHEIASYLYYLYQKQQFDKLSQEEKDESPLPQQNQPQIYTQFINFAKQNQIQLLEHLCNVIVIGNKEEVCWPENGLSEEDVGKMREQFEGVEESIFGNMVLNMLDSYEEGRKMGIDGLLLRSKQLNLEKEEREIIEGKFKNFSGLNLKRIPKHNPETGEWGQMGQIELKLNSIK